MTLLVVEHVTVSDREIEAVVRVTDPSLMRTSIRPESRDRALELLPGLARHSCENDAGARFVDELRDTETAHLLEHVAVELMALAGSPRTVSGRTSWDFARDGRGVFRLRIEFDDDLVALGALKEAVGVVEWVMRGEGAKPDIGALAQRLSLLRRFDPAS